VYHCAHEVFSLHLLCSLVLPLVVHIATTLGSLFRLWVHPTLGSGIRKLVVAAASSRLISRSADGLMTSTSSSGGGGEFGDASTKWHGSIDLIIAAPVERVWAIGSDWLQFPRRCVVECTEGQSGVPGCVRKVRPHDSSGKYWAAEKLVYIDHHRRIMAYDLVGGNIGIEPGYQAVFQVRTSNTCLLNVACCRDES
jgi:hypothetical protein